MEQPIKGSKPKNGRAQEKSNEKTKKRDSDNLIEPLAGMKSPTDRSSKEDKEPQQHDATETTQRNPVKDRRRLSASVNGLGFVPKPHDESDEEEHSLTHG